MREPLPGAGSGSAASRTGRARTASSGEILLEARELHAYYGASHVLRGVDLDTASRQELYELPNLTYAQVDSILRYREQHGALGDGQALVRARILTERELLAVAPFLTWSSGTSRGLRGWAQAQTRVVPQVLLWQLARDADGGEARARAWLSGPDNPPP